jgi:hypothetical protein
MLGKLKKKIWTDFQRIIELFTQKIVTKLSKIWARDPGSETGKNLIRIPDPGVKNAPDPGSSTLHLTIKKLTYPERLRRSQTTSAAR